MAQDGHWPSCDFHSDLTPEDWNIYVQSMDNLSFDLNNPPHHRNDHNAPINRRRAQGQSLGYDLASLSSGYPVTLGSFEDLTLNTAPTVYSSYNSSSLGETSHQYQPNTQQAEPPVQYLWSQTDPLAFVGVEHSNPSRPPHLNITSSIDANFDANLDAHLAAQAAAPTRVNGMQIPPPPRPPSVREPIHKQRSAPRVAYRCGECGVPAATRQSCKRHVETQHHPQYDYHCDVENCTAFLEKPLHRPDKLLYHYAQAHLSDPPSETIIEANRREHPPPPICTLCRRLVADWDDFWNCFLGHCKVEPAVSKASSPRDSHRRGKKRRDRDNSDRGNCNGRTGNGGVVSQAGYGHSGNAGSTSNSWLSSSGGNQYGRSHQQSSQPQHDVRNLQYQPSSQMSRSHCKSCQHPFENCSSCCDNPPSTPRCHACPDAQRSLAMQAGVLHAGPSWERSPQTGQAIGVADHVRTGRQVLDDVNLSIPTMAAANPLLDRSLLQGTEQLDMHPQQQAQAHGLHSGPDTQQSRFASDQSRTVGAGHDVQVVDLSELKIEPSIFDLKSKKAQSSANWSTIFAIRGPSPPAHKPHTGVSIATLLLIGPLSSNKVNLSSMCQCPCRTSSQGTYFARSGMGIAPGRRIEVDLKMAPEAHGLGHPLRTRIHVVVRMLRLRSSVAKSVNDRQKQKAYAVLTRTREVPLEPIKAMEPFEEDEKKIELIFDLDLQSSLNKLSRWTGLPTGNFSSDLSLQDLDRVFEYLVMCLICVLFVIASLARAQEYNSYPCLAKRRPGQAQEHLYHASYCDDDTPNSRMIF